VTRWFIPRCPARALVGWPVVADPTVDPQWKRCIREPGHREPRHVWLESFARAEGHPFVLTWTQERDTAPLVAEVHLPDGPVLDYTQ
jgi:hypothetical protein